MYRCQLCDVRVASHTPCTLVPVATREKEYPARPGSKDPGGYGHEIVREARACPECASGASPAPS